MKLGEFRKLTSNLPDDAEIVVRTSFNDEKCSDKNCCFDEEELNKIDFSKPIVFLDGGFFESDWS